MTKNSRRNNTNISIRLNPKREVLNLTTYFSIFFYLLERGYLKRVNLNLKKKTVLLIFTHFLLTDCNKTAHEHMSNFNNNKMLLPRAVVITESADIEVFFFSLFQINFSY